MIACIRRVHGGVCIYVRNNFKRKRLKDLSYISTSGFHQLWIQIQVNKNKSIIVCVSYRPPDCPVTCIREELKPTYTEAFLLGKQIVVMGDLNCNLLKTASLEAKMLVDTCIELNLVQLIKDPTRITPRTTSLLDVIMTSSYSNVKNSGVIDTGISDHCLIYCTIKLKINKPQCHYLNTRSYKNYDPVCFSAELLELPFFEVYFTDDVNVKLDLFNQLFLNTLNKHAPIKHIKIRGKSHPFIDDEIKQLIKLRDRKLNIFKQSRHMEDWKDYKQLRNSVKSSLRTAESNYVRNQIEKCKGNPRTMWKVIRGSLPTKEATKPCYQNDHAVIANEFNSYFTSVGKSTADRVEALAENNHISITPPLPRLTNADSAERFEFTPVTRSQIRKIILKTPSNKAPGPDKIGIQCIKDTLDVILDPLTNIINCSLMTSTYPSIWKLAEVIPLHKEGDHEVASNNRPISLLATLSKICDKVVLSQFKEYLIKRNLLSKHQSGNRENHSTETLHVAVTDSLLEAMDNKQLSIVVFIDLSKAFDSVQHETLLQKIRDLGASPAVYTWFKSYLSDRLQYVRIGTISSEVASLKYGIPQGSVLSPFLFNIYTNSLPSTPKSCRLESYVDDSKSFLSFSVSTMDRSLTAIEEDLERVFEWCCNNSLLINPDKTKMLVVGSRKLLQQLEIRPKLKFIGKTLIPVTEVKDLGITLDSYLNYNEHIQALSSSCLSKLGQISRVKHIFDESTLAKIIDTLVISKINYCASVWSNTSDMNIKKIQLIQNCAARLITGLSKYDHISSTLDSLNWLPMKEHLLYRDTILTFKCINGLAPSYLCDRFEKRNEIHDRDTRNNKKLQIPQYRTTCGQRTFKYRATKIWNALDEQLKSINSINVFKSKLKLEFLTKKTMLDTL